MLVGFQEYVANRHEDFSEFRQKMTFNKTACCQRAPLHSLAVAAVWNVNRHCIIAERSGDELNTGGEVQGLEI